jgi:hypothetical protein
MNKETKMEILKSQQDAYFKTSKKAKGITLTQVCNLCGLTLGNTLLNVSQKRSLRKISIQLLCRT